MGNLNQISVDQQNQFTDPLMSKFSETNLSAVGPDHWRTSTVAISGYETKLSLFPQKIVTSLSDILKVEIFSLIWGKVTVGDKPISDIKIESETNSDARTIYLNEFFWPDEKLTSTSSNGLYIIINPRLGFHSLVAKRNNETIGFANTVVEEASVAMADIVTSMKKQTSPIRVYDAFTGEPIKANLEIQSLNSNLEVNGSDFALLPNVNHFGLVFAHPETDGYIPSKYTYNEQRAFVHIPMLSANWLNYIKGQAKINESSDSGIVVGFVPDEDFEAYLVGIDPKKQPPIIYFNSNGEMINKKEGIAGGGFIIFDVPVEAHEFAVYGLKNHLITTRIAPVDSGQLTTLIY